MINQDLILIKGHGRVYSVCGIKIIDGHQEEFKMDFCVASRNRTSRISEASSILTGRNKTMAYVSDFFSHLSR